MDQVDPEMVMQVDQAVELVVEVQVDQVEQEIHLLLVRLKVLLVELLLPITQITLLVVVAAQLKQELEVDQADLIQVEEVEQEQQQVLQQVQ